MEPFRHGVVHVLLVPDHLEERGDGAVVGEEPETAAGRQHLRDSRERAVAVVHMLENVHSENQIEGFREVARDQLLSARQTIANRQSGSLGVFTRHTERFLGWIDPCHDGALRREGLGEDPAATADVERPLAAKPPEDAAEVLHPHGVQLVQAGERPGRAPPDVGRGLHQALELVRLGQAAHPRQRIAHDETLTPMTRPSRIGATAETTRGSVAARRLNARTPSVPGE